MSKPMIVAGVMSGTSADFIDVSLTRISANGKPQLLARESFAYPKPLRIAVLAAMDAKSITTAELARLNWRLGEVYADAVAKAVAKHKTKADLIGCHGQTIFHQGAPEKYLGKAMRCTWQLGEPALIAAKCNAPVVSNFRPADMAAGGHGAPLVPMLDYVLFRDAKKHRILQNLGGIGNLTVIPAGAKLEDLLAFDTGPANMVIDACMQRLYDKAYDRNGRIAASGKPIVPVMQRLLRDRYFSQKPPKTSGREQFGEAYVTRLVTLCKKYSKQPEDIVATATILTAATIQLACARFVWPKLHGEPAEYVIAGGGTQNSFLVDALRHTVEPLGYTLRHTDDFGIPSQAKESVAFALLAWLTWHHKPSNVPSATGAKKYSILGSITHV